MTKLTRWLSRCATGGAVAAVGVTALAGLTGCQTYTGGMTLPSPHYLQHYPTYFPPDPPFTHQRERDSMLDPTGEIRRGQQVGGFGAPGGQLPPPGGLQQPIPAGVNR